MAVVSPENMNFSNKNIIMIIDGLPSGGKTTLGLSAPRPILADLDGGLARVNPAHRKDAIICNTYEEFLSDIKSVDGKYETIVIDTCGALIEYMKDWAMRTDPKATKKDGGFSLQGYGIIKSEFVRLFAELRKKFNVVLLFHSTMTKVDEGVFYELVVEGSTRSLVYQPADLAAHLYIQNGRRYLGFTPTEQYSAKSAYGIKGIIEVPELADGDPNDFLTKLFAKVRANLDAESKTLNADQKKYEEALAEAKNLISLVEKPDEVSDCAKAIKALDHALTSEKEAMAVLKNRLAELGIVWDKAKKAYAWKE